MRTNPALLLSASLLLLLAACGDDGQASVPAMASTPGGQATVDAAAATAGPAPATTQMPAASPPNPRPKLPPKDGGGRPKDKYACVITPDGYCIFTGTPHQTGLEPNTGNIVNRDRVVLFSLNEAVAVNTSGAVLQARGTPAFDGDELVQRSRDGMSRDEQAFHQVMAIMFPIRNALMYDIATTSQGRWDDLARELEVRAIKDKTFTGGPTPRDNYYGRQGIFDLAKEPNRKDIHHDVMKFLEEAGLYLLCHVTSNEFNTMLQETHPEGHSPCEDAGITSNIPFGGATEKGSPPTFEVLSQHPTIHCLNDTFSKFVDVFGVYVIGTPDAPLAYVEHTANVLAEYIDNNADGVPDDRTVLAVLLDGNFVVPVWAEADRDAFWEGARGTYCEDNTGMAASMYFDEDEWALGGIESTGTWDGNLEEVWHVVSIGWYRAYPEFFGDRPGSHLADAMDAARGGRFLEVPRPYPAGAWYSYYDGTCSYGCQIHEYFYWVLMANIGALDPSSSNKCDQVKHEWRICSRAELEEADPLAFDLLNNQGFRLPTRIPAGSYQGPSGESNAGSR